MLNLSDRELDRLSKEAAQEYEPGEVLGPKSWERLEVRLDNSPGGLNPNPLRHFRRFPFYYAPALLVLMGVSYYFVKHGTKGSGSPPTFGMAKTPAPAGKDVSNTTNAIYPDKSTPVSSPSSVNPSAASRSGSTDPAVNAAGSAAANTAAPAATRDADARTTDAGNDRSSGSAANSERHSTSAANSERHSTSEANSEHHGVSNTSAYPHSGSATSSERHSSSNASTYARSGSNSNKDRSSAPGINAAGISSTAGPSAAGRSAAGVSGRRGNRAPRNANDKLNGLPKQHESPEQDAANSQRTATGANAVLAGSTTRELNKAIIGGLASTKKSAFIPDSNLRKFTLKSLPQGMRPRALYVNRNLQFGLVLAPDFTSVNSLAGNRAGSTVGVTVDYQFANHFYIGSGLLLDRKKLCGPCRGLSCTK